jgi:hypothetical protein
MVSQMTSSELRIAKLTEENYFDWVVETEAALCVKGLWPAVEEDAEFRAFDEAERKRKQREARGFLILCISPQVRDGIVALKTPKEIWEKLRERFCQKTNERKADLIERLTSAEQSSGESVATFVNRVETLKRRLKEEHSEEVSDGLLMGIILKGISSRFAPTIEALRCLDNLALKTVKDKLIAADERMRSERGKSEEGGGSAMQAGGQKKPERGQTKENRGENGGEVMQAENLSTENSVQHEEEVEEEASSAEISEQQQPPVRRSSRVSAAPDRYDPAAYANSAEPSPTDEPRTLREVRMRPDAELWDQAMQEELTALWEKGVYEWVDMPTHKRVLPAKWVYKIKRDKKGAIEKYKARLVAKGFLQKPGVDYGEVFAPASSLVTLRLLLSIAAEKDYDVHQLDVKTAFLNGDLEEEVYLQPPEGYEDKQGRVWLLKKALYGLKQAAQAWHKKLKDSLVKVGLHPSESDPCLFIGQFNDGHAVYLLIHVDDALIVGSSAAVREVKSKFSSLFEVRDLGEAVFFLGLEIVRNRTAGTLWLGQSQYAEKKLEQFGMRDCNPRVTPLEVNQQLGPDGETLPSNMPYSEVVGSLLYLAVCTRPDMSHSVGMLSRFVSAPKLEHWHALKGVLRYLRGTSKLGLMFRPGAGLIGYTDSDYAGDLVKRRSTSGYVFMNAGAAVLWGSKLQTTVAVSTCEAELIAGARAIKEALWLRKLITGKTIGGIKGE